METTITIGWDNILNIFASARQGKQIGKWTISLGHTYNIQRDFADCIFAKRDNIRAFTIYAEASASRRIRYLLKPIPRRMLLRVCKSYSPFVHSSACLTSSFICACKPFQLVQWHKSLNYCCKNHCSASHAPKSNKVFKAAW